jgi:hypothetical protein
MAKRKVSEDSIRQSIQMMRSIAKSPTMHSPFHLAVADEIEKMLEELLELRKQVKEKNTCCNHDCNEGRDCPERKKD